MEQAVSIIIPLYNPNKQVLKEIDNILKSQIYRGKIKIIKVDKGLGLADSINFGLKKSKTDIVVILEQDCIPSTNYWLKNLLKPLENEDIVCSVSKVELPYSLWKNFDIFAKLMSLKEQKIITPFMDEKGCAYKKEAIVKVGYFDGKNFRTAGEDTDMGIKLLKIGKIVYPEECKVIHYHMHTFRNRLHKEYQLSNAYGALVRIHKNKMKKRYIGYFKAVPLIGWFMLLFNFPYFRMPLGGLFWIPLSLIINFIYCFGFWKGFLMRRQTV